ncbi:MAG: DUF2079 domain-containing protein [Candidatus Omnitrophota bacterium]|jgi:uncharacterized membrane protein
MNKKQEWSLQILLAAGAAVSLFLFLTNAIPLIQWGWIGEMAKKSRYVRPMQISVAIFFTILLAVNLWAPALYARLYPVRALRRLMRLRLRYLLAGMGIAYALTFIAVGFARHEALETRAFDLGIFAQAVWNTLQGDFLHCSLKNDICLLGDHFSPLVAALAPLYALWQDPRMLLIVQACAGAACIVPIAWVAREQLKERGWILAFAVAFCLFWPAKSVLHEDFHPEVLVEPLLLLAFILLEKKRLGWFLACLLAAVSAKENIWGIAFMFGVYAFVWKRLRGLGAGLMAVSAGMFLVSVNVLIPFFGDGSYLYRGSYAGLLQNPAGGIVRSLVNPESLHYISKLFGPLLFTSFFHPPTLVLTFPVLFQNLLSLNPAMRSTNYHYTAGLTPFLFVSSVYGLKALLSRKILPGRTGTWVILVFLAVGVLNSGASEYFYIWKSRKHMTPHSRAVIEKLRAVAPGASVLTHNNFVPQLVNRKRIYQFEYIPSPTKAEQARNLGVDFVIFDAAFWEPGTAPVETAANELIKYGYALEYTQDGFSIYRKAGNIR